MVEAEDLVKIVAVIKEIPEIIEKMQEAANEEEWMTVLGGLQELANKIGEIAPTAAPIMGELLTQYASTIKPITDQLVELIGVKASGYALDKIIESRRALAEKFNELAEIKAEQIASQLKAYEKSGIKRKDAMQIIVAEAGKQKQGQGFSPKLNLFSKDQ